jgi:hypothetical protein
VDRGEQEHDAGGEQHDALEYAQGAGLQADDELEVIAEREHSCTGEEAGEVARSS